MKKTYFLITVWLMAGVAFGAISPYVSKVYDFLPAPGQFTNKLPEYEAGDTHADMIRKVNECIVGDEKILISLGAYGGYVVFGFDHMVENKPNMLDFKIWGNAFYANANPNPDGSREGGSCEPGVVMVSYDANANGLPDDEWYELAGSEYFKSETVKRYQIIYYKPAMDKMPEPDNDYPFLTDTTYVKWRDNQGETGYVAKNSFHNQAYYPNWITTDSIVFDGTKLLSNGVDESGESNYFVLYAYPWGYADNHPNNDKRSGYNIDWAVNDLGQRVSLPGIHFVKVYTGVSQYCGWLGETSTEIMGAEDLHVSGNAAWDDFGTTTEVKVPHQKSFLLQNPVRDNLCVVSAQSAVAYVYDMTGKRVMCFTLYVGTNTIPCALKSGIYVLVSDGVSIKFVKY